MRLIDAEKLKQHYSWIDSNIEISKKDFDCIVDVQPTISIVKCKQCKYRSDDISPNNPVYCKIHNLKLCTEADYCSQGEEESNLNDK